GAGVGEPRARRVRAAPVPGSGEAGPHATVVRAPGSDPGPAAGGQSDHVQDDRVELALSGVDLIAGLVDRPDVEQPRRLVDQRQVLRAPNFLAVVGPQAPEPDAQDSIVVAEVGDRQAASYVLMSRCWLGDVAQPEHNRRVPTDSSVEKIPSYFGRDGPLVARHRLLQHLPLRIAERQQRLWLRDSPHLLSS